MRVTFKLFATLSDYLPPGAVKNAVELALAEETTIDAVIERFHLPGHLVHLVLVNGVFVPRGQRRTRRLKDGDVLAIWPPIAGG